jgi:hypothetical protein
MAAEINLVVVEINLLVMSNSFNGSQKFMLIVKRLCNLCASNTNSVFD